MSNAAEHGLNRAGIALPIGSVPHFLALDTVFLSGEGERYESGRKKLELGAGRHVEEVSSADFELHIGKSERMFCVTGGIGIFTGSQQEIKGHPDAIDGSLVSDGVGS